MIPPRTQIKAPSRRLHTMLDILLMEGDRAPEAFILEIQPFTPFFAFGKQHSTVANGPLGSVAGGILRRSAVNERLIARGVALISRPSCHSSSAESLLLRAGDAHLVDGQPLEPTANGVGQQRNHVRQGGGPCGGCRIGSSECRRAGRRGRSGARFRRRPPDPNDSASARFSDAASKNLALRSR